MLTIDLVSLSMIATEGKPQQPQRKMVAPASIFLCVAHCGPLPDPLDVRAQGIDIVKE